jgi:hypothetical protein
MPRARKPQTIDEYKRWLASQGGHGRARALTAKERSESALKAIRARWRKASKDERTAAARKAARARWAKAKRARSRRSLQT